MTQKQIKRVKLQPVAVEELLPSMAEEAKEVLGYNTTEQAEEKGSSDLLLDALRKLELEVLDWRDVRKYQVEQLCKAYGRAVLEEVAGEKMQKVWARPEFSWNPIKIEEYRGPRIPDHVLLKAVQIKRELPDVHVYVEELTQSRDPFLVVTMGEKPRWSDEDRYYIEVWNEPEFEAR